MDPRTDVEIACVELQRWLRKAARQDSHLLQQSWQAIVRSHILLEKPVYRATRVPGATSFRTLEQKDS